MDAATFTQVRKFQTDRRATECVAFAPDSKSFAAVGGDRTVQVTQIDDRQSLEFCECPAFLTFVRYSSDGNRIVSSGTDGFVRIWNARTGDELLVLPTATRGFTKAEFSKDGSKLIVASASARGVQVYHAPGADLQPLSITELKEFSACVELSR